MLDKILIALLAVILLYASYKDIMTRHVPDCLHVCIIVLAVIKAVINMFSTGSGLSVLTGMGVGMLFGFLTMLLSAYISKGRLGGADIKLMSVCGLLLGLQKVEAAFMIGLLSAIILVPTMARMQHRSVKDSFPFVPYLNFGIICSALFVQIK